ncbi:hypothetical protein ACOZ4N_20135 (plasmid) [Halorientalis pallida]|uniref:hypothetical protein n=1 Tax=Halorientalis pallida TaxID=2479928 RepID=UPI003C6FB53E
MRRSVSVPWILALVASKAGDLATTVVGLTVVDGLSERNPLADMIFHQFGIIGLVTVSTIAVLVVVFVVEWAAGVLERSDETGMGPDTVYLLGYFPLVTVFGGVTVFNVVLLCIHSRP